MRGSWESFHCHVASKPLHLNDILFEIAQQSYPAQVAVLRYVGLVITTRAFLPFIDMRASTLVLVAFAYQASTFELPKSPPDQLAVALPPDLHREGHSFVHITRFLKAAFGVL